MRIALADSDATEALGRLLAITRPGSAAVHLHGDLGAGKSTLARALLRELASRRRPVPVDIVLNPFESTLSRPSYDAFVDGMKVGTLGPEGTDAFLSAVGVPKSGHWPRITGTFFTGLETVAGPAQPGAVGTNGLWLSPLIGGPAHLDWSAS